MIKQAAAAPRPCRAKPQLPHPSPFPGTLSGPAGCLFLQTCEKIALFQGFCAQEVHPHVLAALSDARQGGV